jgi:hypothetical protein
VGSIITRDSLVSSLDKLLLNPVTIGVDVGQLHDPTAIAVAEVSQTHTGKYHIQHDQHTGYFDMEKREWVPPKGIEPVMRSRYTIRHIRRLPLNTSYPDVAEYVADMLCNPLFACRDVRLLIDVTGVGRPVYEELKYEIRLRKEAQHVVVKPISFVRGETYNRKTGSLGKAYLVSRLQSLLQGGDVHGPDIPEMQATTEELRVYKIKVSETGTDQYGAFEVGKHDDLATALALACLEDPFSERVSYSKRVY